MKKYQMQLVLLILVLILPLFIHAQPGFNNDVSDAPVDGGLSLLLAAGIGYGTKKIRRQKNRTI